MPVFLFTFGNIFVQVDVAVTFYQRKERKDSKQAECHNIPPATNVVDRGNCTQLMSSSCIDDPINSPCTHSSMMTSLVTSKRLLTMVIVRNSLTPPLINGVRR